MKNVKQIEEMAGEFADTNYEHPELKECSRNSYTQGIRDFLDSTKESESESFSKIVNDAQKKFPAIPLNHLAIGFRYGWQASRISTLRENQEMGRVFHQQRRSPRIKN